MYTPKVVADRKNVTQRSKQDLFIKNAQLTNSRIRPDIASIYQTFFHAFIRML